MQVNFIVKSPCQAQEVSRRPYTAKAGVRFQVIRCEICGWKTNGTGEGFSQGTSVFLGLHPVAYPGILFWEVQQIRLKTENRENGDLGAVAP